MKFWTVSNNITNEGWFQYGTTIVIDWSGNHYEFINKENPKEEEYDPEYEALLV